MLFAFFFRGGDEGREEREGNKSCNGFSKFRKSKMFCVGAGTVPTKSTVNDPLHDWWHIHAERAVSGNSVDVKGRSSYSLLLVPSKWVVLLENLCHLVVRLLFSDLK